MVKKHQPMHLCFQPGFISGDSFTVSSIHSRENNEGIILFFDWIIWPLSMEVSYYYGETRREPLWLISFGFWQSSGVGFACPEIILTLVLFWCEQLDRRAGFTAENSGMFLPGRSKCSVMGSSAVKPCVARQNQSHVELKTQMSSFPFDVGNEFG